MLMSTRLTVSFTDPQMAFLKKEAKRLGVTVAEIIRRLIDEYRDQRAK